MADGYGYGSGYRQHHWGKGGKGWGEHGLPNLNWALAWEGHAGLHFFTRFPKGVTNPFILSLPEGFVINRHWWGQDGSHWATTHDLRFDGSNFNKKIVLVGDGFKRDCFMWWDGNKEKGTWIVRSWPQYAVAVPKGDKHIWYRATFQFLLNNGSYYSGYWEMEGGSVPNVFVTLGDGDGVLGEVLDDPRSAVGFVTLPQHRAALGKTSAHHANLLGEGAAVESDVVGGGPVITIPAEPFAVDDKSLGKTVDKRIRHSLGEAREEMETGVSLPCERPGQVRVSVFSEALATGAPLMLAVSVPITVTVGGERLVVQGTEQMPVEAHSFLVDSIVPVRVENSRFFVPPVSREVFAFHDFKFPVVASDFDAWFPEFDVFVDVGGVGGATIHHQSDDSVADSLCH